MSCSYAQSQEIQKNCDNGENSLTAPLTPIQNKLLALTADIYYDSHVVCLRVGCGG